MMLLICTNYIFYLKNLNTITTLVFMTPIFYILSFHSENRYVLRLFLTKIEALFNLVGATSVAGAPKNIKKITVLRSTHVNKKSKEQLESCKIYFSIKVKVTLINNFLFKQLVYILVESKPPEISFKIKQIVTLF